MSKELNAVLRELSDYFMACGDADRHVGALHAKDMVDAFITDRCGGKGASLVTELALKSRVIRELASDISGLEEELRKTRSSRDHYESIARDAEKSLERARASITDAAARQLSSELRLRGSEIDGLKHQIGTLHSSIERLRRDLDEKEKLVVRLEAQRDEARAMCNRARRELSPVHPLAEQPVEPQSNVRPGLEAQGHAGASADGKQWATMAEENRAQR